MKFKGFVFSFILVGILALATDSGANYNSCTGPDCYKDISLNRSLNKNQRVRRPGQTSLSEKSSLKKMNHTPYRDGSIFPSDSCEIQAKTILEDGPCRKPCPGTCVAPKGTPCRDIPASSCSVERIRKVKTQPKAAVIPMASDDLYDAVHRSCKDFAPIELQWVDFRIKKDKRFTGFSNKLGQFRFRIFGCRRETKDIFLNQGRTIQKDMRFLEIFEQIVNECYQVVKTPNDLCINSNKPLPEYILTAEITDYFMNVCDEHNWEEGKKENLRNGSAEMTVVWRLMDLTKTKTLWKGSTTGYAEIEDSEYNADLHLVEKAFADAVDSLHQQPGFERQLAVRVSPEEMADQKARLIAFQQKNDPIKCEYKEEIKEAMLVQSSGRTIKFGEEKAVIAEEGETVLITLEDELPSEEKPEVISYVEEAGTDVYENSGFNSSNAMTDGIEENSGFNSSNSLTDGIEEKSGSTSYVNSQEAETNLLAAGLQEKGGSLSSGASEDTGSSLTTSTYSENLDEIKLEASCYRTEDGQLVYDDDAAEIIAAGGSVTKVSCVVEDIDGGDYWMDVSQNEESSALKDKTQLCIKDRKPYDELTEEALNEIKASVVSIENSDKQKGAGLLVSENIVLTSADLIVKENNLYKVSLNNGTNLKAKAFRINPNKNIALLALEKETTYHPLAISYDLPDIGSGLFTSLGLVDTKRPAADDYIENKGTVSGYRYSDNIGTEIIVDTFVQNLTIGSVMFDDKGTIFGVAHMGKRLEDGPDLYIPIDIAIKAVGLDVCGREVVVHKKKTITKLIESTQSKDPGAMKKKDRK